MARVRTGCSVLRPDACGSLLRALGQLSAAGSFPGLVGVAAVGLVGTPPEDCRPKRSSVLVWVAWGAPSQIQLRIPVPPGEDAHPLPSSSEVELVCGVVCASPLR